MKKDHSTLILGLLLLVLIIGAFFSSAKKTKKDELAKYYGITRTTLAKWILYFPNEFTSDTWKKLRLLSSFDVFALKIHFGTETDFVLTKAQIADKAESDYKTVAKNVLNNLHKLNLTKEAWDSLSKFPPNATKRILEHLG